MPYSNYLEIFGNYIYTHTSQEEKNYIKNHQKNYDEFCDNIANLLSEMRLHNYFSDYPDYDFLDGEFREKHPEAFIEKDAPEIMKKVFYKNQLTPSYIKEHPEVIPYLVDKDLLKLVKVHVSDRYSPKESENYHVSFAHTIVRKFGNNELLNIYAKYGESADRLPNLDSIQTVDELENEIHKYFYDQIINHSYKYDELKKDKEFVAKHSSLFIDLTDVEGIPDKDREFIERSFHDRYLSFEIIHQYPQLVDILIHKDLSYAFGANGLYRGQNHINYLFQENPYYEKEEQQNIQQLVSKEDFLKFCVRYGRFLENRRPILNPEQKSALEIQNELDQQIIDNCRSGKINYFPQEVPDFVKEQKDLFLSEDAPEELYKKFYSTINDLMTFRDLKAHPEWMPYLEGKSISTALIKSSYKKDEMIKYFNLFGNDRGVKFGINKPDTVEKMINSEEVDLMKQWYDKTNQKFIPDIVIMHNFSLENCDKFLKNGPIWSNLMRIKNYAEDEESREALLKLAYTFGAFDGDNSGYKKAVELFTGLPRVVKRENAIAIDNLRKIEGYQENLQDRVDYAPKCIRDYLKLKDTLIKEGFQLDESKSVTDNIYAKQEDESYKLIMNPQNYPKSTAIIRTMMEKDMSAPVLSPAKAHQLFGGFELKYDKDFREFFLNNFDKILENNDSPAFLSSIQKQFQDIKVANSNRHLTWDLAVSYVQSNRFEDVEVGNEKAAEVSAIAGYTQEEFNVLQQIYNHGKTRIFHSIPRVVNQVGDYTYEVLKLNDPLAMAIGTLTDCCQEIGNAAEMCMEHSMVSNSGRIFIIKDEENNIVAQSWLWRNKDTICFDNIEIPDRAFTRKQREGLKREEFTDQIYNVYKSASEEMIKVDKEKYQEAVEKGELTEEEAEAIRIKKATVGLGYNDIAASLKKNASLETGPVKKPLNFEAPVELGRNLYTNDSQTQYVIKKEEVESNTYSSKEAPYFYHDDYEIRDDSNFNQKDLLQLQKLEAITNESTSDLKTDIGDYEEPKDIVSKIGRSYGINKENTRIVLDPNFAIIYEDKGYEIEIADLLFHTKVGKEERDIEDKVAMQMHFALEQISDGREIHIEELDTKKKTMFEKTKSMEKEINRERGVNNEK